MTAGAALAASPTLDAVKKRGQLVCGVNTGLAGFASPDDKGVWRGFDVDFCRAVSAAIFGGPDKVTYKSLTGKTRFPALQSGEIDLLSRNTTWTFKRDVNLGFEFIGVTYYDGQGFIARKEPRHQERQGARRRLGLHPDRHHDRAQPGRLSSAPTT